MKFAEPIWLIAGAAALAILLWLFHRFDRRQRAALSDFASSHLLAKLTASFSPGRRRVKRIFFAAAVACTFLALARPQWGYHWQEEKRRGIDIVFAIDTSKSMLTQDVNPDRLSRAKLAVTDLVNRLDGDRVGLIAFAGDAFLQAPLTLDYDAFNESLDAVNVGVIPRGGTDIASAIEEARVAFSKEGQNRKILILITDGEDLESRGIDAARDAAKDGLTIYTIGVGSAAGGLIPVPGADGGTDFLKDASGQFVKSHLDENTLKQIAQATGGLYEPLGQQGEGLETLYNQALAALPKHELASRSQRVYEERFQWPLALGLICLLASMMIGTRKSARGIAVSSRKQMQFATLAGLLIFAAGLSTARASVQSAGEAYKKGDYATAEHQYEQAAKKRPQAAPLQFNLGAAAYKDSQYDKALPAFQSALGTDQLGVQQEAYYDIGNTQYRLGQKTEKSQPQQTIQTWKGAVQSYEAALKLKPDDADAQFNRDFVQKKLDQLQQQQKQDQQKQQQNQQDQKKQSDNSSQNQSQGGQGKQPDQKQPGQQNQAQNGKPNGQNQNPGQNQNGQNGQQNPSQGQPQTAGNQGAPNQGQEPKPAGGTSGQQPTSMAQNGEKPAGPLGQTIPDKDQSKPTAGTDDTAAPDQPGQMSKQEARDLLNSLKGNEHALAVTQDPRNQANHPQDQPPLKDW